MEITFLGHSAFKIKTKQATIITDPFKNKDPKLNLKFPSVEADIVTVSHGHDDHSGTHEVKGNPFVINAPGEFEIKEVNFFGYQTYHD